MDIERYKKIIRHTVKELQIHTILLLGKGKSGIIFLVNDEIVVKIPLKNESDSALWQKNEAVVLRFLEGKLDIEIPKILFAATSECGLYIIGETRLSGITFSYELYDTFDEKEQNDVLRQVGKIARQLHDAGKNDWSWHENPEKYEDLIIEFDERFSIEIRGCFSRQENKKIEEIAERYQNISVQHPVNPVLCHNDLHFYNLMFDTENKRISGVLDFGCAGYTEPSRDFHYYFDAKCVLEGYGDNGDAYFSDRQKFHALSNMLSNLRDKIADKQKTDETLNYIRKYIFQ
jgi:aminoglycoside 2''-phosphotransferase